MKIKDITNHLETIAPLSFQEPYDNSGLIVGSPEDEIKKALICLDCIEEVVDEAIGENCQLIIAHHPIVFSGIKKFNGNDYVQRTIIKAIKNNIAIYAIHTNLDNVHVGVNQKICDKLEVFNTDILFPKKNLYKKLFTFCPVKHADKVRNALFESGAGKIGDYDNCSFNSEGKGTFRASKNTSPFVGTIDSLHHESETKIEVVFPHYLENKIVTQLLSAHPYEEVAYDIVSLENYSNNIGSGMIGELENEMEVSEFLNRIKTIMKTDSIRYTKPHKTKIKKVAVCGGSGSFLLHMAIKNNADIFITSDFKYHQFFDANNQIIIADIGHYESEQFTIELISELIVEKFPKFALRFSKLNTNPINYL